MTDQEKFLRSLVKLYRESGGGRLLGLIEFCRTNNANYDNLWTLAIGLCARGLLTEGIVPYTYRLTANGYRQHSQLETPSTPTPPTRN